MTTLHFMDVNPVLRDGDRLNFNYSDGSRCNCMTKGYLVAKVREGKVVWAGCEVCGQEAVVEVCPDGKIGFFPMGVVVI